MATLICSLVDHSDDVNWCAFSSTCLATCSLDKTIRLYSIKDFSELPFSPLNGHGYAVHSCCFSSTGELLASCSTDGTTVLWSVNTGEIVTVLQHPGRSPVRICTFSPDSSCLVSGAADGTVALWDVHSNTLCSSAAVKEGSVVACSFAPCGQMFVTGSTNGDLCAWSCPMKQLCTLKTAHDLGVTCCQFSPQACNGMERNSVYFQMASCGQDNNVKIWMVSQDVPSGCEFQLVHTLNGQSAPVLSCAFSSDGQLLVSGSVDKSVVIYDANKGIILNKLTHHERYVTACAFAPDMPFIATGSMDKTVTVWRIEDGTSFGGRVSQHSNKGSAVSNATAKKKFDSLNEEKKEKHLDVGFVKAQSRLCVSEWSEEAVSVWLCEEGLDELVNIFKANNIDGSQLLSLNKEIVTNDLNIESLGLRNKVIRKIEELKEHLESICTGIPDEFLCPINRELMEDPVIASDGYSYEREAIESWIHTKKHSSPMTNLPLKSVLLTPNRTLKMAISRWKNCQ